ncbi:TPA: poly(ribitol-phosphate) beta-N-acetylglucosaminyltransferase [Staphylococcus aureus]|uniref:poly(ribitol-phosphate) beta-N-acetylglucosaminyltransferase n=1 Tax=Staphylococcus aureus TaxID=1280 RepID=UPI0013C54257|nr:poly(ribitol-phosphate) beta-N-acetylglucosaminyltransferase [Staphylococcus aureus]NHN13189.1 glycosyltransferase family 2 protein [Staphylococcus aureus]QID97711.1 glycosyltransferase family 2 protein [Staphylococcus aureus]HDH6516152.1 poly(ribitol-phosphate) beta-N-acetylglucosaminyltransferase [Staphylococcus aureus]HDH6625102.1 poly(ribitol-phosphate) beta-N-acetylglucosaminyltransferase [Staphylococcus aureus]HDH6643377.1 poly(ribitol-phosphate) beta-N-acetylglucosaminyltransferase [
MMKFSVIVPTYNSEKYMTELLNSLAKQDFPKTEFEVVVVDDCSTDQTLQIVEKYRNKLNLKVSQLETNSGGPGKPRNVALKQAEGEFVLFVDSDDYINKETLKDAAAFIDEHHSDVLLIKMKGVNGRGVPQSMFKETAPEVTLLNSRIIYTLSPTKIYRTALLKDNDIYFPEELKSAEDQLFTMKAYLNANRISVLSDKAYYYATKREGEHMSSAYVSPEDFYEVMRLIAVEILNADLEEAHKDQILAEFLNRHFSFSRTNGFSLKVKLEDQPQWINALGDFIQAVPERVDALVMSKLRPFLHYARAKDIDNYRTVEESYRQGQYYRFDIVDGKLNIQFNEGEPYFEGIDIAKPKVKMTAFKFDNHKIVTELTLNEFMIGEGHYDVRLKLHSRNKKHTMYVPLSVNANKQYRFNIMLEDIKAYLPKEKIWDVFLEVQIGTEVFEVRVGNQRNKYAYTAETSALIHLNNDFYRLTPYFTKDFNNISLYFTAITLTDSISLKLKGKNKIILTGLDRGYVFEEGMASVVLKDDMIMGMLSQTSENEVEILLSKDIKKRDFKNIVKLNTAHMTYSLK